MNALSPQRTPHAQECEQAVLGACLLNNEQYWVCAQAGLKGDHFAYEGHRKIWQAMEEAIRIGSIANPFTLAPRFRADPAVEGGHVYLAKLVATVPGLTGIADYAQAVIDSAVRRTLVELSAQVERAAVDLATPAAEIMTLAESVIGDLRSTGNNAGPVCMKTVAQNTLQSIERAHKRGKVEGIESGLKAIDRALGGLADTDLIVLAGRPGMGKSALAGTIAHHVSRERGVAMFSLEMSAEQLAARILSGIAGIDSTRLRKGDIGANEFHRVAAAADEAGGLRLHIDDTPQIKPNDMRARLKRLMRTEPIKLIVVDYIQLMHGDQSRRENNRVLEIGEITGSLKAMAKEFRCPVLALSQLSRAVESRDDKRPMLSDLRDSGSIEQDADQVWFLYRDEYYASREEPPTGAKGDAYQRWMDRMAAARGQADLIVAKNRHGPDETLKLAFEGRFGRFGNL